MQHLEAGKTMKYRSPPGPSILATLILAALFSVFFPCHGRADPVGKPRSRFREYLEALLKSPFPLPDGNSILVIGDVLKPGEIKYRDGITAAIAIIDAGGLVQFATGHAVGIWKDAEGRFAVFDLKKVLVKDPSAKDPILEAGDVVIVLESKLNW
jgi:hypothetical protein